MRYILFGMTLILCAILLMMFVSIGVSTCFPFAVALGIIGFLFSLMGTLHYK